MTRMWAIRQMALLVVGVICFAIGGCGGMPPKDKSDDRYATSGELGDDLPKGAFDVVDLENGWYTFKIKIDSTRYKMLYYQPTRKGHKSAITVLRVNDAID